MTLFLIALSSSSTPVYWGCSSKGFFKPNSSIKFILYSPIPHRAEQKSQRTNTSYFSDKFFMYDNVQSALLKNVSEKVEAWTAEPFQHRPFIHNNNNDARCYLPTATIAIVILIHYLQNQAIYQSQPDSRQTDTSQSSLFFPAFTHFHSVHTDVALGVYFRHTNQKTGQNHTGNCHLWRNVCGAPGLFSVCVWKWH